MVTKNLTMVRGDTMQFQMKLKNLQATVASLYFTAKTNGTDSTPVFQKSLEDGITLVDTDTYQIRVAPADTANVAAGNYVYDLQIGLGSDIWTPMMGNLVLLQDVTNPAPATSDNT